MDSGRWPMSKLLEYLRSVLNTTIARSGPSDSVNTVLIPFESASQFTTVSPIDGWCCVYLSGDFAGVHLSANNLIRSFLTVPWVDGGGTCYVAGCIPVRKGEKVTCLIRSARTLNNNFLYFTKRQMLE